MNDTLTIVATAVLALGTIAALAFGLYLRFCIRPKNSKAIVIKLLSEERQFNSDLSKYVIPAHHKHKPLNKAVHGSRKLIFETIDETSGVNCF